MKIQNCIYTTFFLTCFSVGPLDAHANESCLYSGSGASLNKDANCITDDELLGSLDLVVPENSLFTLMGATPENVIRPKTGSKFALSFLPHAVDALGNDQYSIGFEVNPGLLMMPDDFTINEFVGTSDKSAESKNRVEKLNDAKKWSKFSITGAATKSTEGQEITKYGFGLTYVLDDGRLSKAQEKYGQCIKKQTAGINSELISMVTNKEEFSNVKLSETIKQNRVAAMNFCKKDAAKWNRKVQGVGAAIYHSKIGNTEPTLGATELLNDQTGYGIWASTVGPISGTSQYNFSAQYTDDQVRDRKVGDETISESVKGWRVGGRLVQQLTGNDQGGNQGRAVRGFVEAAYAEEEFGIIKDSFTQAGVGVEVQLQENLFFQATIGDTFGSEIDRDTYLSGQLKWSFSRAGAE